MNATTIIQQARTEGLRLSATERGTIELSGDQEAVKRWRSVIRDSKPEIMKALLKENAITGDLEAIRLWLTFIGETDPDTISCVIDKCKTDPDAHAYFCRRSQGKNE